MSDTGAWALFISIISLGISAYVARIQYKQNRDLRVELSSRIMPEGRVLAIEAFNDGHRPVVIDEYGFELRRRIRISRGDDPEGVGFSFPFRPPFRFTFHGIVGSTGLPFELEPGKSALLWLRPSQNKAVLEQIEAEFTINKVTLVAILRDQLDHEYRSHPRSYILRHLDLPEGPADTMWDWL